MSKKLSKIILEWRPNRIWTVLFQADYDALRTVNAATIRLGLKHGVNTLEDENKMVVNMVIKAHGEKEDMVVLHIRVDYDVKMENFERVAQQLQIPVPLVKTILEYSYHLLQGIWFAKLEGTRLEEFVLPMIPEQFLVADILPSMPDT